MMVNPVAWSPTLLVLSTLGITFAMLDEPTQAGCRYRLRCPWRQSRRGDVPSDMRTSALVAVVVMLASSPAYTDTIHCAEDDRFDAETDAARAILLLSGRGQARHR
jgi:hypothetical protein